MPQIPPEPFGSKKRCFSLIGAPYDRFLHRERRRGFFTSAAAGISFGGIDVHFEVRGGFSVLWRKQRDVRSRQLLVFQKEGRPCAGVYGV